MSSLLDSELFNYHFTFDDWANQHADPGTVKAPFNGNPMQLRRLYGEAFRYGTKTIDYDAPGKHQIRYRLNMLPSCQGVLKALTEADEDAVFRAQVVQDLVDYRWERFGEPLHRRGFCFHVLYVLMLLFFVSTQYLQATGHPLPACAYELYRDDLARLANGSAFDSHSLDPN